MIQWMLAIWPLVPLPFLNSAWTSGSSWFTCCWNLDWKILSIYFASMWDEGRCEVIWTFPDSSVGKESACNAGEPSLIPGLGRCPGEGDGYLLQDSGRCPWGRRVGLAWATFTFTWTFLGVAFLWDWNENWPFLVLWPLLSFPNLLDIFLLCRCLSQKYSCVTSRRNCEQELWQR